MKDTIIFDLDGTLANIEHRLHYVKDGNSDWDGFFEACMDDEPILETIEIYNMIWMEGGARGYDVGIYSGRSDQVMDETRWWLNEYLPGYDFLRMREAGDHQPDWKLKRSWAEEVKDKVLCVFDDRNQVVDMWRSLGTKCYQVAPGGL